MTKRRAIAVVQPGEIAVLHVDRPLNGDEAAMIKHQWATSTGTECVILSGGVTLAGVCNVRPWKSAQQRRYGR